MKPLLLAACIVLLPTIAHAQWSKDGQPTPDAPDRKSKEGFGAQLLVISHLPEFMKEWTTSPPEHVPHVPVVTKAERGAALAILVFLAGCKADTSGHCNADYDLTIIRPDGSTMHNFPNLELSKQEASTNVQLGPAIAQIKFDRTDSSGTYHIRAVVRDENRNVVLELETPLEIK